jgi:hypothetical protein
MQRLVDLFAPGRARCALGRRELGTHQVFVDLPQLRMEVVVVGDNACDLLGAERADRFVAVTASYDLVGFDVRPSSTFVARRTVMGMRRPICLMLAARALTLSLGTPCR